MGAFDVNIWILLGKVLVHVQDMEHSFRTL